MGQIHSRKPLFPSTHWSEVERAAAEEPTNGRPALSRLLDLYLPALRVYLLSSARIRTDKVDDLLQSFVAEKVLKGDLFAHADRERGTLRTFLLRSIINYANSQLRKHRALRRGGGRVRVSLDDIDPEDPTAMTSALRFDLEWAKTVLSAAAAATEAECRESGRFALWRLFDDRVIGPTLRGQDATPYEEMVRDHGFESPAKVGNLLVTAKRMYERHLRRVVRDYVASDDAVEQELADLRRILNAAAHE